MLKKQTIEDIDVKGKRVLTRVDFNVPLDEKLRITDTRRIDESLPTIKYLLDKDAKVILMSHLGRPKGIDESLRMKPIFEYLKKVVQTNVVLAPDCVGLEVEALVNTMKPKDIVLLENLRFHPEEEKDDPKFVAQLAKLGDVYVNDAFGTSHRAHASTEGLAHVLPGVAGYLMKKEIDYLENAIDNATHPFVAITGGKKVSDKITVLKKLLDKVDTILFGGGMVFTFLKIQGKEIGSSIIDTEGLNTAKEIIELAKIKKKNLVFPDDIIIADKFSNDANVKIVSIEDGIPTGWQGLDIGPKTIEKYDKILKNTKTVLWNGPVGVFEMSKFAEGTKKLAKTIAETKGLISIIGGGDTAAAIQAFGFDGKMSHISTGGGASLELLEGKALPGVVALKDKK